MPQCGQRRSPVLAQKGDGVVQGVVGLRTMV